MKRCSITGCEKPYSAKGLCSAHYSRQRKTGDPLTPKTRENGVAAKYFREVVLTFDGDECLVWPFARCSGRYGFLWHADRNQYVHRLVCEEIHGPPPSPLHHAAHSCGRGEDGCVNPRHVSWKTPTENANDKRLHGTHVEGERHGKSKLNVVAVRAIRRDASAMPKTEIAAKYGIGPSQAARVIRKEQWAWLD